MGEASAIELLHSDRIFSDGFYRYLGHCNHGIAPGDGSCANDRLGLSELARGNNLARSDGLHSF